MVQKLAPIRKQWHW